MTPPTPPIRFKHVRTTIVDGRGLTASGEDLLPVDTPPEDTIATAIAARRRQYEASGVDLPMPFVIHYTEATA